VCLDLVDLGHGRGWTPGTPVEGWCCYFVQHRESETARAKETPIYSRGSREESVCP
jgi:hypothetical protein